jgi:hypothetical protein
MPRSITIDKTVIEQLDRDNRELANFLNNARHVDRLYLEMTAEDYSQLNAAEKQLCEDLGVKHGNSDEHYVSSLRLKADSRMKYIEQMARQRGEPDPFKSIAPEHEARIGLAFGDELLTFDPKLAETYNKLMKTLRPNSTMLPQGVVPELANIPVSTKPIFYDSARKNLNLRPLSITPAGAVLPTPGYTRVKMGGKTVGWVTPDREGFIPVEGPRTSGGSRTTKKIENVVADHEPVTAPMEYGPSATGQAAFEGGVLILQGINYLLSKINGPIQQRRFQEAWDRKKDAVFKRLNEDPQLGAMIYIYYSSYEAGEAAVIDGGLRFQDIQVAYGFTQDEALRAYRSQDTITAAGPGIQIGDKIWHKPRAPLDIGKLQLPVGASIAGLATFVPGKEKFVRVKYRIMGGFDDAAFSKEELDVPKDMMPRFFYLWPPKCVTYMYNGYARQIEVDWTISDDADESIADIDATRKLQKGIPAVKLDSNANPSTWFSDGATAAMVWPADNATANLFLKTHGTSDSGGCLAGLGYTMVRWVRPEFVRVLKDPFE